MPIVSRPLRALAAAPLLFAMLLGAAPSPAAALEPPRPLPGYRPTFVTQTDVHPTNDCLWASGAMLIDKWTNGKIHPTHQRLRALSGDRGGSNLADLKKAYKKLGINLKFSPNGGERITFNGLLRRLAHGAGAVVLGDDSKLPRWYGRWDYGFWKMTKKEKKKHPSRDNHAVYVERYDRRHGRVWLMDPLAKGDWHGEWISIWALRKFAWSSGGALYTAVTPTAKPAPFAHVTTSAASLSLTTNALQAQWSFRAPRRWHFPGVTTRTAFTPAADPVLAAATAPDIATRLAGGNPPLHTYLTLDGRSLTATAPLPKTPGAYLGSFKLTDRRFGRTVAAVSGVPVFVPGHRTATVRIQTVEDTVEADSALPLTISVANTGELTWAETPGDVVKGSAVTRNTRLVARWIPLGVAGATAAAVPAQVGGRVAGVKSPPLPALATLERMPLDAGRHVEVDAAVHVPTQVGTWALAIDVVDDVDGSFAKHGTEPAIAIFQVIPPRGVDPVQ